MLHFIQGFDDNVHQYFKSASKDLLYQDDGRMADLQPLSTFQRSFTSHLQSIKRQSLKNSYIFYIF